MDENLENVDKQMGKVVKEVNAHQSVDLKDNRAVRMQPTEEKKIEKMRQLEEQYRKSINNNLDAIAKELDGLENQAYALKKKAM